MSATDERPTFILSHGRVGSATFSECRKYRYSLRRCWNPELEEAVFVGLNPSTADADADDPTMRRVRSFCEREGWGAFTMLNLFAIRATDPREAAKVEDPVGPFNDDVILSTVTRSSVAAVVACWGSQSWTGVRPSAVMEIVRRSARQAWCFGTTKNGSPKHPLYLRADTPLVPYSHPTEGGA